jgi:hypothetical protein
MSYDAEIVKELKKMNEFLEKIDWKLWNLHEKYAGKDAFATPANKEQSGNKDIEPVVPTSKYPTIETWE